MKRPIQREYTKGVGQMEFGIAVNKFHSDLEKYVDYLEELSSPVIIRGEDIFLKNTNEKD